MRITHRLALLVLFAGCGEVKKTPVATTPDSAREVASGGGRVQGTTFTLDVQVGHPLRQATVAGPTFTLESNAAVRP